MRKIIFGVVSTFFVCITSCKVEDYNLSDISTDDLVVNTAVSSPIGQCFISVEDLVKQQDIEGLGYGDDGVVVFAYDTVQHFQIDPINTNGFYSQEVLSGYDLFEEEMGKAGITKEQAVMMNKPVKLTLPRNDRIKITTKIGLKDLVDDTQYRIDSVIFKEAPVHVILQSNINGLLENCSASIGFSGNKIDDLGYKPSADKPFMVDLGSTVLRMANTDSVEVDCYLDVNKQTKISITPESNVVINIATGDAMWKIEKAWGVFNGLEQQLGHEVIPIDIYDQEEDGVKFNLQVEDPRISLKVHSNIGIPFRLGVDKLEATNGKKTETAIFENGKQSYNKDLNYAQKVGDNITALDVTFNKKNGGIDKLVNMLPKEVTLDYRFEAVDGDLNGKENYFITDDAYIDMICKVELPAYLRKGSYILSSDTIKDIEFGEDLGDKYSFKYVKLKALVSNTLPFNAKVSFFFLQEDEKTGEISIIPDNNINKSINVKAGRINSKSHIVERSANTFELLEFKERDIPSLKKAKHILIMYEVAVNEFDKVKVTRNNKLNIVLNASAKGSVNVGKLNETKEDENN